MAITETRNLPAQFIEDLGKDYAKQLTATTAIPVDTSKFAPQVAAQDALQTRAATLAGQGVGSFAPFIQAAQQQAAEHEHQTKPADQPRRQQATADREATATCRRRQRAGKRGKCHGRQGHTGSQSARKEKTQASACAAKECRIGAPESGSEGPAIQR